MTDPVTTHFSDRHIGPSTADIDDMLSTLGVTSLDALMAQVIPDTILDQAPLDVPEAASEEDALAELRALSRENVLKTSLIGQGYYGCHTPQVILRNVLENPGWYTSYTPYQPEISQGRLEVLFNFQTLVSELTGLPIANASLLDEATAAAEAMAMCHRALRGKRSRCVVDADTHPQTLDILRTRAEPIGITLDVVDLRQTAPVWDDVFAVLVQTPGTSGELFDCSDLSAAAHDAGALVICATDLLALSLLRSPADMGADVAIGSAQRFGVPLGFGGPHAAFMATQDKYKRSMPGRLIGQSIDANGKSAYRLALQTREQHIRREKATSNICTAQALLAVMATLYACYHGPQGLRAIARRVHSTTATLAEHLRALGFDVTTQRFFDTVQLRVPGAAQSVADAAEAAGYNLRRVDADTLGMSLDETTTQDDLAALLSAIAACLDVSSPDALPSATAVTLDPALCRDDQPLSQTCFHAYQSETEMMRYLRRLADKDLALDRSMIPLGSCTMKLNAAAEMAPVSWPEFTDMHPFVPAEQSRGYRRMITQVERMLSACTGYDAVSLQPNAGSQGEYAGLLAIKRYHEARGQGHRNVCLIPGSAHGTNPAS
ncbi:MAG TPA: aminomethyl-transferring glycine dehydrogenase subunit GcvPA, partial [Gammaproteobacteria bacterium]|nr:aminomethyl-transferring glycine dehydrogenase subunit GcvPA [Gammaproteobacteria bacterium]